MTDAAPIRRGVPDDAEACTDIILAWLSDTDWLPDPPSRDDLIGMLRTGIPIREFWVIGDPVEGYLSLEEGPNHIHGLYTAKQGQGLGKALIDKVKEGRDRLQLYTHMPNHDAHRFYHREGFVTVEELPKGRGDGVGELKMEWVR